MRHKFPILFAKIMSLDVDSKNFEDADDGNNDQQAVTANNGDHVFLRGMRPVIFLGRIFGLLSRKDITSKQEQKRKFNIASALSACFAIFFFVNAVLLVVLNVEKFQKDKTTLVRVEGFHHALYSCSMSFVYCYQFFATSTFRKIVQTFVSEEFPKRSNIGNKCSLSFPKFCLHATCTCFIMGVLENALFDWQNLSRGGGHYVSTNDSVLELSYTHYFNHWHVIFSSYNTVITFILVVLIKLGTWGWVHMDTICIVLCRALWEKLGQMEKTLEEFLASHRTEDLKLSTDELVCTEKHFMDVINWDNYQDQYVKISQLVEQVEIYICPLILACYAGNIYIIIVMLFNWIGPLSNEAASTNVQFIHVCFAFFQYSFRVAAITHFAAEVYQKSLVIRRKIQCCPNAAFSVSVERLERTLVGNPTGICLLGSFIISRKYFISIISFIFTAEIVLLQTYSSYYVPKSVPSIMTPSTTGI